LPLPQAIEKGKLRKGLQSARRKIAKDTGAELIQGQKSQKREEGDSRQFPESEKRSLDKKKKKKSREGKPKGRKGSFPG